MPTAAPTADDLAALKRDILREIGAQYDDRLVKVEKWRRILEMDRSTGRLLTGPQFIDTVAIDDGAITAAKLEADLVLSTSIIAGAASPADRLELDATGLKAYGTVSGTPNTNTVSIGANGNFTLGVSPNQVTFVASTGVLTVPSAVISGLTIAAVGSGNIGGTYSTASVNPKLQLSTAGIQMYNSAGTRTVFLDSSNGNFTLSNDPAGSSRMNLTPGAIEVYRGGIRQFYLTGDGSSNTVEMLLTGGGAGQYVGLNAVDGIWLGASTFASAPFRVTPGGAVTATSANITGAITATSGSLQTLSVDGTLTMGASGLFRTGSSSTRAEMDNTGFYLYRTGSKRLQLLADGSGALGINATYPSGVIAWTTAGALTLGGFTVTDSLLSSGTGGSFVTMSSGATAFSAGGATPASAPFRVTSGGALTATSATLTGAITASSLTITGTANFSGGSLTLPSGGTITSSTMDMNSGTMAGLTIDGTLTIATAGKILLNSAGRIEDADGSYWDQDGIVFINGGVQGDYLIWRYSSWSANRPYTSLYNQSSSSIAFTGLKADYGNGVSSRWDSKVEFTAQNNQSQLQLTAESNALGVATQLIMSVGSTASNSLWQATVGGRDLLELEYTNYLAKFGGRIAPGNSGTMQSTRYLEDNGTSFNLQLGAGNVGGSAANWSSGSPTGAAYVVVYINGVACRIPFWANA